MRTIPLFHAAQDGCTYFDDQPIRLRDRVRAQKPSVTGSIEVALAGYASCEDTLYADIRQVPSGHSLRIDGDETELVPYYEYMPLGDGPADPHDILIDRLADRTRHVFEKCVAGLEGRPVMLPLSAGLDSRLLLSAFWELGYRNVHCYAYGLPGNFEAKVSQRLAEQLGVPWHFLPYVPSKVRAHAQSALRREYTAFADTCASIPFLQDLLAIEELKQRDVVPSDAVFINGNSGDFTSGGHIPKDLWDLPNDMPENALIELILNTQLNKHYSLWPELLTPAIRDVLKTRLTDRLKNLTVAERHGMEATGAYEFLECHGRQANFVVTGQRVYEFFGHDWRLPLWDTELMDFWERVPPSEKFGQKLYKAFLRRKNWAGIWDRIDEAQFIRPRRVAALRNVAKVCAVPFGRAAWHRIDKRIFAYWTDILCTYANAVPYSNVVREPREFRNALSFRGREYLRGHGRRPDGAPLECDSSWP